MKQLAIGVLLIASTLLLTSCCNSGCGVSTYDYAYTSSCCGTTSSCCGSGGW